MSQWRPPYNGHRFADGFKKLGYQVSDKPARHPQSGDILVMWNRHPGNERYAKTYEDAGASVLIVENGYFGRNWRGSQWYALAIGQHNGPGRWPDGDGARWAELGAGLAPWRRDGTDIVILAQRGIGSEMTRQPQGWVERIIKDLQARTMRRIRIRKHPGAQSVVPKISLEADLSNAWAAITWASGAAVKALAMGVPVFHGLPGWVGAGASRAVDHDLEDRFLGDREPMFRKLAHAVWSIEEIESGDALTRVLACA